MDEVSAIEARIQELQLQLQQAKRKNVDISKRKVPSPSSGPYLWEKPVQNRNPFVPPGYYPVDYGYMEPSFGFMPYPYSSPPNYIDLKIEALQQNFQQQIDMLKGQTSPQKSVDSLETQHFQLQESLKETQESLLNAQDTNNLLRVEIQNIQKGEPSTEVQNIKDLNTQLESKLNHAKSDTLKLERELEKTQSKLHSLIFDLDEHKEKYEKLTKDIKTERNSYSKEINYLKCQLQGKSSKESTENDMLRSQLDDANRLIEELKAKKPFVPVLSNSPEVKNRNEKEDLRHEGFAEERKSPRNSCSPEIVKNIQNLEYYLMNLQFDKTRLESEITRLPKNNQSVKRREELELELEIVETNIQNLKSKLSHIYT